jgi:myosin XVIII
LECKLKQFLY